MCQSKPFPTYNTAVYALMKYMVPLTLITGCFNGDKVKVEIEVDDVILSAADTSASMDDSGSNDSGTTHNAPLDRDSDGYTEDVDCDDTSSTTYPGAPELCNQIDDNCNGEVDEGAGDIWYSDLDGDGYGHTPVAQSCSPVAGAVNLGADCDDENANIFPGNNAQVDGVDSDCDGVIDWKLSIYAAVDDAGTICINGTELGDTGGWTTGRQYEIWMPSGTHTVGINGWDTGMVITAAIAHLEISNGSLWVTDDSWRYDPQPDSVGKQGWCSTTFDDSSWDHVKDIGPIGTSPWGNAPSVFPQGSPAHWIWDHFPVNLNTQYLRTEFSLP